MIVPRDRRYVRGRQHGQLAVDLTLNRIGDLFRRGQKDCRRGRAMLRLPQQVCSAHLHVGGVVGDDQGLGWAGQ